MDRSEDWPDEIQQIMSREQPRSLRVLATGEVCSFWDVPIPVFDPLNEWIYRDLHAGLDQLVAVVYRSDRHPAYVFELIGMPPPAEGIGSFVYWADGSVLRRELVVRRARAHVRGSPVKAEMIWRPSGRVVDGVIYPTRSEPKTRLRDVKSALAALEILDGNVRNAGGRPVGTGDFPDEAAFRAKVEPIIRALVAKGGRATRADVAKELERDPHDLRRLCRKLTGLDWPSFVSGVV